MDIAEKRKAGEILERGGIAQRIIQIAQEIALGNYENAVENAGRIAELVEAASYDECWDEKVSTGRLKEQSVLKVLAQGKAKRDAAICLIDPLSDDGGAAAKSKTPLLMRLGNLTKEDIIHFILENPFWPHALETGSFYHRRHDDDDGTGKGHLTVMFGGDGDAWVKIPDSREGLRFRTYAGGGKSLRTRAALLILAEAMRLDNEECPQHQP